MDLTTEPAYREERVIDVDYGFASGATRAFTLHPEAGDTIEDDEDFIVINLQFDNGSTERIRIYRATLAWDQYTERVMRIPLDLVTPTGELVSPPDHADSSDTAPAPPRDRAL